MNVVTEQFNNREIATGIWLLVALVLALYYKPTRKSFPYIFKAFLRWKILVVCLLMVVYVLLLTSGLKQAGFWDSSNHLKDTIIWTVTIAFVMVLNISDATKKKNFFRKIVSDALKLTIVLEFIIGFYSFSLPMELVLIPFLFLLGALVAVADMEQDYLPVKEVLTWLLTIIGLGLLWHSTHNLLANADTFLTTERLIELTLPSILTLLFLHFVYFLALGTTSEIVFTSLKVRNHNSPLVGYAKRRIFLRFGFRLNKLVKWSRQHPNLKVNSKAEVLELVGKRDS